MKHGRLIVSGGQTERQTIRKAVDGILRMGRSAGREMCGSAKGLAKFFLKVL